jgi:dihydrofolate synthase/folylpolyglutamate synthase
MAIAPTVSAITAWLDAVPNRERTGEFRDMQLDGVRALLKLLPPVPRPCTLAGTKGKGSTARFIECALREAGEPTVAFTSPHVSSVLERWRVDGELAEAAIIADCCTQVAALEVTHALSLTYFERTFAIACLLVARRPGTRFILEVGLGGRLDCANALDCAIAVITHLSHDHRDILGPTLHHIAREKLAVTRNDAPVVIAPQTAIATLAIWRELAKFKTAIKYQPSPRMNIPPKAQTVWVQSPVSAYDLPLLGDHQQDNAATAAAALRLWAPQLDDSTMRRGFARATLAARCQMIKQPRRRLLIDGAHNRESIAATIKVAMRQLRPEWRLIIGVASDKEIDEIISILPRNISITRCGYQSPRARKNAHWPHAAQAWPWHDDIRTALAAQPADTDLCITGSFYLAAEALASY